MLPLEYEAVGWKPEDDDRKIEASVKHYFFVHTLDVDENWQSYPKIEQRHSW